MNIEYLREWIGREEVRSEQLTPALVDRFNATFDQSGEARNGDDAPLMIHLCLASSAVPTSALGPDGHPARGGFLPPVELPRRMWAGGEITFSDPICIGELVTRCSTILDVTLKQGRSGALCFVMVEHRIFSADRQVIKERQDIVYRDVSPSGSSKPGLESAVPGGVHRIQVTPTAALLFRYSALTFNGHRIHYDSPYVRQEEGYPGLIVHGPMQATQLVQFATSIRGQAPKKFDFRSRSPLFDIADYTLNASDEGDGLKLWTSYVGGPVAMEARATW